MKLLPVDLFAVCYLIPITWMFLNDREYLPRRPGNRVDAITAASGKTFSRATETVPRMHTLKL